ncbi:hypothetical protein ACFQ1E_00390 [Sphingomonas canadensis]|uniref:Uncharacterized protein n=1 Tax=Sphingomonas canadensis TaxID=1219257 RepID=A0ABW3H0W8_9SPHN|nr:hypothetical protein [Sphingomonas canadensis]MCW3835303.1 hypothetical protein [Sphingomonas canadensis]
MDGQAPTGPAGFAGLLRDPRALLARAAPFAALALAWIAVRTPIAAQYPRTAALLFLWIAADSLTLPVVARARRQAGAPLWRPALAALAAAGAAGAIGLPQPIRAALWAMPVAIGAIAALVALHTGWSIARAVAVRRGGSGWTDVAAELMPRPLARLAAAELSLLRLALFRWNAAPDVPAGATAFAYHRHLAPMMSAMIALQVIEIGVTHLLLSHWSPMAALVLFGISDIALLYMIGLVKSLRLRPVLLLGDGALRVRAGILIDHGIPREAIVRVHGAVTRDVVKARDTLNAALLAWPNLIVELAAPMPAGPRRRPVRRIALRLDDAAAFLAAFPPPPADQAANSSAPTA